MIENITEFNGKPPHVISVSMGSPVISYFFQNFVDQVQKELCF